MNKERAELIPAPLGQFEPSRATVVVIGGEISHSRVIADLVRQGVHIIPMSAAEWLTSEYSENIAVVRDEAELPEITRKMYDSLLPSFIPKIQEEYIQPNRSKQLSEFLKQRYKRK